MDSYILYKLAQLISQSLPLKAGYKLAEKLALFQYHLSTVDRQSVYGNLQCILNNSDERDKIAREVFKNFAKYLVDFLRIDKIDKKFIKENIEYRGLEVIEQVLSQGNGLIAVTAHLGNWELCGITLSLLGYPVTAIAMEHKSKKVTDFFVNQRESKGLHIIQVGIGVRKAFKALKQNKILGILGDRDFSGENGIFLEFFGKKLLTPRGPAVFSIKTGAPIVPVFMIRKNDGFSYKMICEKPIIAGDFPSAEERVEDLTSRVLDIIKQYIISYPAQWFMFRPFWVAEKIF
ncbi:MAG: lysophospholipid acyltransferase family protein [Candidatus Omnitrophota bacterium]